MSKENKGREPEVFYFDAKFSAWWRTPEEAKMNSIEPVAAVNLSDFEKCQAEKQVLEQRLAEAEKQLAIAVAALRSYEDIKAETPNSEPNEEYLAFKALKQIEELNQKKEKANE